MVHKKITSGNNVVGTVIDNPLIDDAVVLNLDTGEGNGFPSTFPFFIVIWNGITYLNPKDDSNMEICRVTNREDDVLTIVRGVKGTIPTEHAQNSKVLMFNPVFLEMTRILAVRLIGGTDLSVAILFDGVGPDGNEFCKLSAGVGEVDREYLDVNVSGLNIILSETSPILYLYFK